MTSRTRLKSKSGLKGKKGKKGVEMRQEVKSLCNRMAASEFENSTAAAKRKAVGDASTATKKTKTSHPSGVNFDWKNGTSKKTTLPRSSSPIAVDDSRTSDSGFQYGGVGSDDEEVKPAPKEILTNFSYRMSATITFIALQKLVSIGFLQSVAKVEPLYTTISLIKRPAVRHRATLSHLPYGAKGKFTKQVAPIVCETSAVIDPWDALHDREIVDIWRAIWPNNYSITDHEDSSEAFELSKTVKSLIEQAISTYRHRLADAAVKALYKDFARRGLETQDERRDYVLYLLVPGDPKDFTTMKRRFIWESSDSFKQSTAKEGLYCGYLVANTFNEHLSSVATIEAEFRLPNAKPIEALWSYLWHADYEGATCSKTVPPASPPFSLLPPNTRLLCFASASLELSCIFPPLDE